MTGGAVELLQPDTGSQLSVASKRRARRARGRGQGEGQTRKSERSKVRQRRDQERRGGAVAHTLAESGEALSSAGAGGRKGRSRAKVRRASVIDERLTTLGMKPLLKKVELLVSASSSVALSLGDVASARMGEQLGTALGEGAALKAPLHGTSGAQGVLITSRNGAVGSNTPPGDVAEAGARLVSERAVGTANQADRAPTLLRGAKEKVATLRGRERGEGRPEGSLIAVVARSVKAGTTRGGSGFGGSGVAEVGVGTTVVGIPRGSAQPTRGEHNTARVRMQIVTESLGDPRVPSSDFCVGIG